MKPYPRLSDEDYAYLTSVLAERQNERCAGCGEPLDGGGKVQIAHRIRRGRMRPLFGDDWELYAWHPDACGLVCSRRLNECNDSIMRGQHGGKDGDETLAKQILQEDKDA